MVNYVNNSNLRSIQLMENELLQHFKQICEEENLHYYLLGGTLIGALRHKGFIPWDDDIDVGMPREDYESFLQTASKYLNKNEELLHFPTWSSRDTIKLTNKNVIVHQVIEGVKLQSNIWMDIFPLDGVPEGKVRMWIHLKKLSFYKMQLYLYDAENLIIESRLPFLKKMILQTGKTIPIGKLFNPKKVRAASHRELMKYPFTGSKTSGNYLGRYYNREFVPNAWFGEGSEVLFEGEIYKAPKEASLYLRQIYGDYMKLPPEEEQKSNHYVVSIELL